MKKVIFTVLIVITAILAVQDNGTKSIKNIASDDVSYIEMNLPLYWTDRNENIMVTDSDKINSVMRYFDEIEFGGNFNDSLLGGGYIITLHMNDNRILKVGHIGNVFISDIDSQKYKIKYEDAIKFEEVYGEILVDYCNETYPIKAEGVLDQLDDGRWVLEVNNRRHQLKTNIMKVFDGTGEGWNMLHDKDRAVLYFQSDQRHKDWQPKRVILLDHR